MSSQDHESAGAEQARPADVPLAVLIGLGGALGAVARFGLSGWVTSWAHGGFPWPTFAVNVVGSLALGVAAVLAPGPRARAVVGVGFCGGFTTFSTFDYETLALLAAGELLLAALYSAGTVTLCVACVLTGIAAAQRIRRS